MSQIRKDSDWDSTNAVRWERVHKLGFSIAKEKRRTEKQFFQGIEREIPIREK